MSASARTSAIAGTGRLIVLLTALTSVGQFASSIYLPSFPAIAAALATDMATVQLTLSVFLLTFAVAQLAAGPVTDRFGRRGMALAGLAVFIAGSLVTAFATSIGDIFTGRVLQALGAAASTVAARAATRDVFAGPELARVMALTTMVFGLVPALAPLLGGALQDAFGWTAPLWASVLMGALVLAAALAWLPETIGERLPALDLGRALFAYRPVLRSRPFLGYAAAGSFGLATLFSFLAGSPAVFIGRLGATATEYGFYPPFAVLAFVIGAGIARRLAGRTAPLGLVRRAYVVMLTGALSTALLPAIGLFDKIPITLAMIVFSIGFGVVIPTSVAAAVGRFPDRAGTASALIGFLQLMGSALGTATVSLLGPALGDFAFPVAMALLAAAGAALFLALARPGSDHG